jgi:hypothetical protein
LLRVGPVAPEASDVEVQTIASDVHSQVVLDRAGSWLAFAGVQGTETVDLRTQARRTIPECRRPLAFSPGGDLLVCEAAPSSPAKVQPNLAPRLALVRTDSGQMTMLAELKTPPVGVAFGASGPVALLRDGGGLVAFDLAAGSERPLWRPAALLEAAPVVSADGAQVFAFTGNCLRLDGTGRCILGRYDLFRVDVGSGRAEHVARSSLPAPPVVSPDGRRVLYRTLEQKWSATPASAWRWRSLR